jgi:hypothetical protein
VLFISSMLLCFMLQVLGIPLLQARCPFTHLCLIGPPAGLELAHVEAIHTVTRFGRDSGRRGAHFQLRKRPVLRHVRAAGGVAPAVEHAAVAVVGAEIASSAALRLGARCGQQPKATEPRERVRES